MMQAPRVSNRSAKYATRLCLLDVSLDVRRKKEPLPFQFPCRVCHGRDWPPFMVRLAFLEGQARITRSQSLGLRRPERNVLTAGFAAFVAAELRTT